MAKVIAAELTRVYEFEAVSLFHVELKIAQRIVIVEDFQRMVHIGKIQENETMSSIQKLSFSLSRDYYQDSCRRAHTHKDSNYNYFQVVRVARNRAPGGQANSSNNTRQALQSLSNYLSTLIVLKSL